MNLDGKYLTFEAEVGVQWQGGERGSVVFEVWVDGEKRFDSGMMNDSAPAQPISLNLAQARELRLVAKDGRDGISCDMANWAEARLTYDSCLPDVGRPTFYLNGVPVEEPVEMEGSYAHIGKDNGSQFFFNRPLGYCLAYVPADETATISFPLQHVACPIKVHLKWKPVLITSGTISLSLDSGARISSAVLGDNNELTLEADDIIDSDTLHLSVFAEKIIDTQVIIMGLRISAADNTTELNYLPAQNNDPRAYMVSNEIVDAASCRVETQGRRFNDRGIDEELVEWDWRMQDGIGTGKTQNTYKSAMGKLLDRGDAIIAAEKMKNTVFSEKYIDDWQHWRSQYEALLASTIPEDAYEWEHLWQTTHFTMSNSSCFAICLVSCL